jgi:hypothetical protein
LSADVATVRLLFVDEGRYHHEEIEIPTAALERHERLIDCLQEESEVLKQVYVDVSRLCSAQLVEDS